MIQINFTVKKILIFTLILWSIFITACASLATSPSGIRILVDGQLVRFNQQPSMEQRIILAPMAPIVDLMGAEYRWNDQTQTLTLLHGDMGLAAAIGNNIMEVRNRLTREIFYITLPVAPRFYNRVAFFPVAAIVEALGAAAFFDEATNTMHILSR